MSELKQVTQPLEPEVDDPVKAAAELLPSGATELTIPEALDLAVRMLRQDRLDGARTIFERVLQAVPEHPDALSMLGLLEHRIGRTDVGLPLMRRAVELLPDFVGFQVNLGNVLIEAGREEEALQALQRAAELAPQSADIQNNLGAVHRVMGDGNQAKACFLHALQLDPQHPRAWNNIGLLLDAVGDAEGAIRAYLSAMKVTPENSHSAFLLGTAYARLNQLERAAMVFREWMVRDPDNPQPRHMLAAVTGQNVPERASDAFVETEFDGFAASFERVLNERLAYRAPALCAELLGQCLGAPAQALVLLDAGCGTGLCGPLVAPWARELVGVDLSGGMLQRARGKGCYTRLIKAELTAFLQNHPSAWDAIVCADTLCYFGDLQAVMQAAAQALRPGAVMVYTVEALPDDGADSAALQVHGRYAHGRAHIDRVTAAAGLQLVQARRDVLRNEGGQPVNGWLVAVRRSS
jgi:predicted TPR repeat methyltransferase